MESASPACVLNSECLSLGLCSPARTMEISDYETLGTDEAVYIACVSGVGEFQLNTVGIILYGLVWWSCPAQELRIRKTHKG